MHIMCNTSPPLFMGMWPLILFCGKSFWRTSCSVLLFNSYSTPVPQLRIISTLVSKEEKIGWAHHLLAHPPLKLRWSRMGWNALKLLQRLTECALLRNLCTHSFDFSWNEISVNSWLWNTGEVRLLTLYLVHNNACVCFYHQRMIRSMQWLNISAYRIRKFWSCYPHHEL